MTQAETIGQLAESSFVDVDEGRISTKCDLNLQVPPDYEP